MRVKTLCSVMLGVAGLVTSMTAQAQDAPTTPPPEGGAPAETTPPPAAASASAESKMLLGADLAVGIPLGNFGDGAGIGIIPMVRFEYAVMSQLNITARAGYGYHLPKDIAGTDVNFSQIPFLVGAKFGVTDMIYLAGELGMVNARVSAGGFSASETNAGATVGAGAKLGDIDLRAGLHILDLGNAGDSMMIALGGGFNFAKF